MGFQVVMPCSSDRLTFQNLLPPFSGSKNEPSKKPAEAGDKFSLPYSSILKMEVIRLSKLLRSPKYEALQST
jgi:hypothetical protein